MGDMAGMAGMQGMSGMAPGMVMVLEPVIWDDGDGGYRSEEVVVVTETGYRCLSRFPYMPFDEGTVTW